MLFIGKPKGRSMMISIVTYTIYYNTCVELMCVCLCVCVCVCVRARLCVRVSKNRDLRDATS